MNLDELFLALREASITEYEAEEGPAQEAAVRAEGAIVREIAKRDGAEHRYRTFVTDEHPSVRFRGAVGLEKSDPSTALRVLREISEDFEVSGALSTTALLEVIMLEKRGVD